MRYRLEVTLRAERVLDSIYEYGQERFNSKAAKKFVGELVHQIKSLAQQPKLGVKEPSLDGCDIEYRSLVIHKYFKVIYVIDESTNCIYIVDIWDTRMLPEDLADQVKRILK